MKACYFYLLIVIYIFRLDINCLKIKNSSKGDSPPVDPERIPGINIHLEYNDLDPVNTRRYDEERISTLDRIREMELKLNADKNYLESVAASQVAKISEVSQLALTTYHILDSVSTKKYNKANFYYDDKEK
jgi:hypothetical protein